MIKKKKNNTMEIEMPVVIVGAGPAGLATSVRLHKLFIPNIILEKDDCHASLWRKRTYDRLKLHIGKKFCNLPHLPIPSDLPNFVPRVDFLRYLDNYVNHFKICIRYNRYVDDASFDVKSGKWRVCVRDNRLNIDEIYVADYLVVATGENCDEYIPMINGLESFEGEYLHSSKYLNGRSWYDKNVLIVGSGNSGMEIAYDVSNWGANTSIVIRSHMHPLTKEMVFVGMCLMKYLSVEKVDKLLVFMSKMMYGDMSKYGLIRPKEGPFSIRVRTGRPPSIDVGCIKMIKKGKVKVYPTISRIKKGKIVEFVDGKSGQFDVIVFATGYRSNVLEWLKDYKELFNENGMPKGCYPNHWKGENGLYCAFSRRALQGIVYSSQKIANDISLTIDAKKLLAEAVEVNARIKLLDE